MAIDGNIYNYPRTAPSPTDIVVTMAQPDSAGNRKVQTPTVMDLVAPFVGSRAPADGYYFNGQTGARAVTALGSHAAGLGDFTAIREAVEWPSVAPSSAPAGIILLTTNAGGIGYPGSIYHLSLALLTSGTVLIRLGTDTDYRQYSIVAANLFNLDAVRTTDVVLRRAAGVMSLWIAGVSIALPTESTLGSPAAWSDLLSPTYDTAGEHYNGASWNGRMGRSFLYNCAWSDAEILTHAQTGRHPTWGRLATGSMVNRITGNSYSFSGGNGLWSGGPGATGTADAANAEIDITTAADGQYYGYIAGTNTLIVGRRYRVEVTIRNLSLVGGSILKLQVSGAGASNILVSSIPANGTYSAEFIAAGANATGFIFVQYGGTSMSFSVFQPKLYDIGPLYRDDPDPNYATRDRGANGLHGSYTTGVSYLGEKVDSAPALKVSHSASGPLQFNGGPVFNTSKGWVIDSLIVRSSAAVTWSLGNVSSGAQYVNALAIAVGDNRITDPNLVTRIISGANLWSYNATAVAADITIFPKFARTT